MGYNVIVADNFKREFKYLFKKYRSLKQDLEKIISSLEENPKQGEALGKDCYKVRMPIASKGKGKSGGGRIITCVKIISNLVILLTIYDKSEQVSISNKELEQLIKLAGF